MSKSTHVVTCIITQRVMLGYMMVNCIAKGGIKKGETIYKKWQDELNV